MGWWESDSGRELQGLCGGSEEGGRTHETRDADVGSPRHRLPRAGRMHERSSRGAQRDGGCWGREGCGPVRHRVPQLSSVHFRGPGRTLFPHRSRDAFCLRPGCLFSGHLGAYSGYSVNVFDGDTSY